MTLEDRRRQNEALKTWRAEAPKHAACGGPIVPAGPGRPVLGRPHPAPNHVWCDDCGQDWLEQVQTTLDAVLSAWDRYEARRA